MSVYRVTAHLETPVATSEEIVLDGLLAAAHPLARKTRIRRTSPIEELVDIPVPVFTMDDVRLCTAADYSDDARLGSERGVRRKDAADVDHLARPFHRGLGPGKDKMDRIPLVMTRTATWWTWSNGRGGVRRMLKRIYHVGGRRSHGYGRVSRWEIDLEEDLAPVDVVVRAGRARRPLPLRWCDWVSRSATGALVPPYWHPERQVEVVPVGARCALKTAILERLDEIEDNHRRALAQRRESAEPE